MTNYKAQIIKTLEEIRGFSTYQAFLDWTEMLALSIQNTCYPDKDSLWEDREKMFTLVKSKYSDEEYAVMAKCTGLLITALEEDMTDILGDIYMNLRGKSASLGQFFTPFNVCHMMAAISLENEEESYSLNEPTCGSGGMIIAAAKVLHERNEPYQQKLSVVAQDIDWSVLYLCYIQMSLLGIKGICVHGNTLTEPYSSKTDPGDILLTPMTILAKELVA